MSCIFSTHLQYCHEDIDLSKVSHIAALLYYYRHIVTRGAGSRGGVAHLVRRGAMETEGPLLEWWVCKRH